MEERILRMKSLLDERQWRLYLANEAMSAGYGGVSEVSRITGVSRTTITKGIEELKQSKTINGKVRNSGGGPKSIEEKYPDIKEKILNLAPFGRAFNQYIHMSILSSLGTQEQALFHLLRFLFFSWSIHMQHQH